jgi:hypothetical protein
MIGFFDSLILVKEEKSPPPQQPLRDKQAGDDRGDDDQFPDRLQVY